MKSLDSIYQCFQIQGADSLTFLNNLLISDISSWPDDLFIYSAICNPKGRIICSLWVKKISTETFSVLMPKNMPQMESFLKMRTFRMKVEIQNILSQWEWNDGRLETISDSNNTDEHLNSEEHLLIMQELGLPWIDANNTEKFIPQHVNLDQKEHIMSFTKGCYPGQEIIARMKYLGKIKKRMKLFLFDNRQEAEKSLDTAEQVSEIVFNPVAEKFQVQMISSLN